MEELVRHRFINRALALQSITHSSYSNELSGRGETAPLPNNERLEFLGDAVIGLVVAKALMERFPHASEGKLSRWRSSLVSRKTLAEIAVSLNLGNVLLLGRGESRSNGQEKRSILAAALEAVVGALYLDVGIEKAEAFLRVIYSPWFSSLETGDEMLLKMMDKKTHLQERAQSVYKATPVYRVVDSWGPEHEKFFRVEIVIEEKIVCVGDGRSKKDAEQQAAGRALEILEL